MFHTTSTIGKRLTAAGFTYLPETQPWNIEQGGTYYTTRNSSSVIAFKVGTSLEDYHFRSPHRMVTRPPSKSNQTPSLAGPGESQRLNVEVYGGAVDYTWFDRPLGIAGRVMVKTAIAWKAACTNLPSRLRSSPACRRISSATSTSSSRRIARSTSARSSPQARLANPPSTR